MSHLARRATELNSDIVGRRTNPGRTIIIQSLCLPEANVMALLRAVANGFFKGQIFFPAEKIEVTNRSLVVRFPENRINDDANAAAKGQGIGWIPSRCGHGADELLLGSDERNVEWIPWNIACGLCHSWAVIEHTMSHFMMLPKTGENYVSDYKIGESNAQRDSRPGRERSLFVCVGTGHGLAS